MKKLVILVAVAAGVAVAGYRYKQAQREKSLWAEAIAEPSREPEFEAAEPTVG